jgi:hypothetical protein
MVMLHAAAGSYSDDDGDRDGDGGVSVHVPTTDFIDPTKKPRIKTTSVIPVLPVPTHPLFLSATHDGSIVEPHAKGSTTDVSNGRSSW